MYPISIKSFYVTLRQPGVKYVKMPQNFSEHQNSTFKNLNNEMLFSIQFKFEKLRELGFVCLLFVSLVSGRFCLFFCLVSGPQYQSTIDSTCLVIFCVKLDSAGKRGKIDASLLCCCSSFFYIFSSPIFVFLVKIFFGFSFLQH